MKDWWHRTLHAADGAAPRSHQRNDPLRSALSGTIFYDWF